MDELKKAKIITAVSGTAAAGLLTMSVCAFMFVPGAQADNSRGGGDTGSQSGGPVIQLKVDQEVYDAFMAMIDYYNGLETAQPGDNGKPAQAEIAQNGDTYCIIVDGRVHELDSDEIELVETAGGLYVIVDGKLYELVLAGRDKDTILDIANPGGTDPEPSGSPSGQDKPGNQPVGFDDNGKPIIAWAEDGRPIIGYDPDGLPIYGYSNPNIRVDANGVKYYHIVWGDTLCKISSELHISVDELAEYNHIRNVNLIYAESDLRIPDTSDWTAEDLAALDAALEASHQRNSWGN